ncbi:transketolase, partial [Vibrio cholerae O1]|nr:transketolase [Vibrio cholerae O1]
GVHGAPLGEDERKLTFENYGLDPEKRFNVSEEVYEIFQNTMLKRANEDESRWNSLLEKYAETYPELAEEFKLAISGKLPK